MKDKIEYLGDGVYAFFYGGTIELRANDHINPTDRILLDPSTIKNLIRHYSETTCMVPNLVNRGDGADGHYCIIRKHRDGHYEVWDEKLQKWCSAGTVFNLG